MSDVMLDELRFDDQEGGFYDPLAIEDIDEGGAVVFEGDTGGLQLEERRCLVYLLKKHVLSSQRNPKEWGTLVASQPVIKSRLNDLLLDLVIDHDRGVAYKVQVRHAVPKMFPPLLHDTSFSREETVLLVFLRQRYASERAAGQDRVFVDRAECRNAVSGFRPANATNVTGDDGKANSAVDALKANGVLTKSGQDDRFEISSVIEVLLPVSQLRALVAWFIEQNSPESAAVSADDHDEESEDD